MKTNHHHVSWHFAVAASVILSGCLGDATLTNQAPTGSTPPPKIEKKPLEQIEGCSKRIIAHIAQEISSNPEFQSLQYIKSYVADELRKSGFSSAIVSARIFPFIPNNQGTWDYLSIQVNTPKATIEEFIGTKNRKNTLPIIEMIIKNFEHAVQLQTLHAFAECIKNNDDFSMGTLYREIHTKLSEKGQTFTQHGFEYRGIEFHKDHAGKCIIKVKVYDVVNEREVIIPIETDTKLEIKRRKRDDGEPRETMIA